MNNPPILKVSDHEFFESNTKVLKPPTSTLGAAALALHYANLIIVMEKMIRSPQLVGVDARDDLYSMLPNSVRSSLRSRLKGVGFSASDPVLAGEWKDALQKILGWLSPLAHNMIKWQSERSFEQQNLVPKTNVLLLQTLYFANQEKTEAAITELLVGLNYIWRFEREMNAKALFECTNFNNFLNLKHSSN
uniref:Putative ovule protein n=2 Tax=Solanum TaxID=4107 RepID=A0A0V0HEV6_SOLCH